MPKNTLQSYSGTAASNTDVGGIDIDENNAPSTLNDAIREVMSHIADWLDAPDWNGVNLGTEQASTSGTEIDFTSIPTWVTKIAINFVSSSTDGTDAWIIQIGDSGGIEDSGYNGAGSVITSSSQSSTANSAGFILASGAAANVISGSVTLTLEDSSAFTWVASGVLGGDTSGTPFNLLVGGAKALSAALDRIRITTTGGTDAFDGGAINIHYS